ncbi:MAG: hypothetical protein OHK0011_05770 [Turneriella sp.]
MTALSIPTQPWASNWEAGLNGAWSVASRQLPAGNAYTAGNEDARFIDFGGRLAYRLGPGFLGLQFGLYSSFGLREQLAASNPQAVDFVAQKYTETGLPVSFTSGIYRLALGWNALQLRYRYYLVEFLFAEAGAGAAYGFGGIEADFQGSTSAGSVSSTYYHRFSEWGLISSASAGFQLPLGDSVSVEAACEFAWLWADIREPNIFAQGELTLSQSFFRPVLGFVLKF